VEKVEPVMPRSIDLNADLGEGFGVYRIGNDAELLSLVTSANIACGFHAGDPLIMDQTVAAAVARGVAIGAHPGYPDLLGFGRRDLAATPDEISAYVVYQLGALQAVCAARRTRMRYVKPHGALYNRGASDVAAAAAIASAVQAVDPALVLLGLAGSALIEAAQAAGLRTASEAFADRAYAEDGTLVPRTRPGSVHHDIGAAVEQGLRIARDGRVTTIDGHECDVRADSICVHGDTPRAVEVVRALRAALIDVGISVAPFAPVTA
jgi:UPF0271 protein